MPEKFLINPSVCHLNFLFWWGWILFWKVGVEVRNDPLFKGCILSVILPLCLKLVLQCMVVGGGEIYVSVQLCKTCTICCDNCRNRCKLGKIKENNICNNPSNKSHYCPTHIVNSWTSYEEISSNAVNSRYMRYQLVCQAAQLTLDGGCE